MHLQPHLKAVDGLHQLLAPLPQLRCSLEVVIVQRPLQLLVVILGAEPMERAVNADDKHASTAPDLLKSPDVRLTL